MCLEESSVDEHEFSILSLSDRPASYTLSGGG